MDLVRSTTDFPHQIKALGNRIAFKQSQIKLENE